VLAAVQMIAGGWRRARPLCMMSIRMECHCLAAHELPHTSKLYSAFLTDYARVQRFYAHSPDQRGVKTAAKSAQVPAEIRSQIAGMLREQNRGFGAGADVQRNIDKLAAGAVAVVTGQQVGLFGGPAYSFYKALTAIALAKELTAAGTDAVPVFWLASEDHDLAEIDHCYWPASGGVIERLALDSSESDSGKSVGRIELGAAAGPLVKRATELLEGESYDWIAGALHEGYTPAETYSSAFGKLFARLLAGRGLILLNPIDPRLHRMATPVYTRALEERSALTRDLLARGKELDRAGFHAQVKVTERGTLLFLHVGEHRTALRKKGDALAAGAETHSAEMLRSILESSPERFSANALLRPVVQDSLLPTAAYIGGPAEIAYFAQSQVIYERLLGRMPAVLPRAGYTLVDSHVAKLLKRYDLKVQDVLAGRQRVRRTMELVSLPRGLARQFDGSEKTLRSLLRKLRSPLRRLDRTLEGALGTAERKMLYQFLKIRGKAGRAENLRTGVIDRHERALLDSLSPHHAIQERVHSLLPWLARYGPELLDELGRKATGGTQHQVLFL